MTTSRLSQGRGARNDLVSFVAEGSQGSAMNDAQLRELLLSEGLFFVSAGCDTTAAAIGAFFFYISRKTNSEAYNKLSDEIRNEFSSAAEIQSGPKLTGCHYLRACIDEAMSVHIQSVDEHSQSCFIILSQTLTHSIGACPNQFQVVPGDSSQRTTPTRGNHSLSMAISSHQALKWA